MSRPLLFAALLALTVTRALAQMDAEIGLERDNLLLYEPIRLLVQLTNLSPDPLDLSRLSGEKPWLEVFIARPDDTAVSRTEKPWVPPSAILIPGQKRTLATDLLPVFQVREPGSYRIHVRVLFGGRTVTSRVLKFTVERGTSVWQQQVILPPDPKATPPRPRVRLYSLLVHLTGQTRDLFVRIQDPKEDRVFCTTHLGPFVNSSDLGAKVDREGGLHVLQRAGARIFRYSHFTATGKPFPQRLFSDMGSSPRLASLGNEDVEVVGGEEVVVGSKEGKLEGLIPTAPVGQSPRDRPTPSLKRDGF